MHPASRAFHVSPPRRLDTSIVEHSLCCPGRSPDKSTIAPSIVMRESGSNALAAWSSPSLAPARTGRARLHTPYRHAHRRAQAEFAALRGPPLNIPQWHRCHPPHQRCATRRVYSVPRIRQVLAVTSTVRPSGTAPPNDSNSARAKSTLKIAQQAPHSVQGWRGGPWRGSYARTLRRHPLATVRRMPESGYSGTPLSKKIGIAAGLHVVALNPPRGYRDIVSPWPGAPPSRPGPMRKPTWFISS